MSMTAGDEKPLLRARFRKARAEHHAALPDGLRALILSRPPAPVARLLRPGEIVGLYHAVGAEAPTRGWAQWLAEQGHPVALPWFANRTAPMEFRVWDNPWSTAELEPSPWGGLQPASASGPADPTTVIVPLLAFTADGHRLGQGGGHYDRWLEHRGDVRAIGLAWDCQLAESLPVEPHDRKLDAVVTPTQIYGLEV